MLRGWRQSARHDECVATTGTRAICEAMAATGVRRLVVVSAAPIGTVPSPDRPRPPRADPGDGFWMRHLFSHVAKTAFHRHYADLARMEDVVRASGLDWTITRPPKLDDRPLSGTHRSAVDQNVRGGWVIGRADTAAAMLGHLDQPGTIGHVVGVAR